MGAQPTPHSDKPLRKARAPLRWLAQRIEAWLAVAATHVALPFRLALETGQKESDILRLARSVYDGASIRLRQSKTGRHLTVPPTATLRERLDQTKAGRSGLTICATPKGERWTKYSYSTLFQRAKTDAQIEGRTFPDTRGTAIVNLALAGCSAPEICAIPGLSLKDAEGILDKPYLSRDRRLTESAIKKLEEHKARTKL